MIRAALLGLVLAGGVLLLATYGGGGGLDGPCLGGDWARSAPEAGGARATRSWWPPGIRCTVTAVDGSVVGERTYPAWWVWLLAALVAVAPVARRRRRARSG